MKFEQQPKKVEMIGAGAFKRVYRKADSAEVRSVMKHEYSPEQMKGLFYLNKIAQILFPGVLSKVSQAGVSEDGTAQFYTDYIPHDEGHSRLQGVTTSLDGNYHADNEEQTELLQDFFGKAYDARQHEVHFNSDIQSFLEAYIESGLTNHENVTDLEWGPQDVILEEGGRFHYVDISPPWSEAEGRIYSLKFQPMKLKNRINALVEPDRSKAQDHYDRLMELAHRVGFTQ